MNDLEKYQPQIHTKVLPELSSMQFKVAVLVTKGFSEKEIADKLCVTRDTVHTHTYNIRKKWNARCAVDIARKFLLSLDDPKKYFTLLTFLIIQFHIIVDCAAMDLRKPARTSMRVLRTGRTGRKNKD